MEECSICLSNKNLEIAELECGHSFHFSCIGKYQQFKNSALIECPLCRRKGTIVDVYDLVIFQDKPVKVGCEMIHINKDGEVVRGERRCCWFA